ncbi:hypothetical protein AMELA_G00178860 [Ameiurus melas]|uniref:MANSC domain-containing protein n=1 Tax=Ameiurus melas TaxID=219545 RepID=A0A7J6A9D4_AMEME|nr:hypothetical protein AMELA_G00178860 [Ameiurus melas]
MFPAHRRSFRAAKLLLGALIFLQACRCALGSSGETCYSRQHRDTIVNVHKALDHQKTIMDVRKKEAERDCILACCSVELKPGIKCNMVVYKPSGQDGSENCYLFHCETEQDCPLMSATPGTNTYDIFKGLTHPLAKEKERVPTMPITNSLALLVVLTLIILTFVVAIVGRRAMESFDRRHYTRLELNDLHYEI